MSQEQGGWVEPFNTAVAVQPQHHQSRSRREQQQGLHRCTAATAACKRPAAAASAALSSYNPQYTHADPLHSSSACTCTFCSLAEGGRPPT